MRLVAPGKVVVLGEYAVLDGAPAVVVAVDRGVRCTISPSDHLIIETPGSNDRFVRPALLAARAPAARYLFEADRPADTSSKAGLGSSASATVVATLAGMINRGESPSPADLHALGLQVHRAVQGSGSGIDVAASAWGGVIRMERQGVTRLPTPAWTPAVVWSGQSAATGPRVERYRSWIERRAFVQRSTELVNAFVEDPIEVIREAGELLLHMAAKAGLDYQTPGLNRIIELANTHGGAAKASGAGGGDVAIALFADPAAQAIFCQACDSEGLTPIPCSIAPGAHVEVT
ncbi:MAG: phosphomevalonate kinase [Kiritimatiellia bacterium]